MLLSLTTVAIAFTVVTLVCLYDMGVAVKVPVKLFRLMEAAVCAFAAFYYWEASVSAALTPSVNLRYVWLSLCIVLCAEIISRQDWGSKKP